MSRQFTIGIIIAFVICGGLFFFLRPSPNGPDEQGSGSSKERGYEDTAFDDSSLDSASSLGDPTGDLTEVAPPEDLTEPPILAGDVLGDGAGIPNAKVMLFSAQRVEAVILRAESELSGLAGGGVPDIAGILGFVRAELESFRRSAIIAETDETGHFEVRGISGGGYFLLTVAPKWLFRYGDVVALSEERTETITLELDRGASVAGRIVRPSGSGIGGVRVLAEFAPASTTGIGPLVRRALRYVNGEFLKGPFETVSGPDGEFEISSLPPGTYNITAYNKKGLESTAQGVVTGTTGVVVLFGDGALIKGSLATPRGFPLAETPMRLERIEQVIQLPIPGAADFIAMAERLLGMPPRETTSDAGGGFAFKDLGAGRYRLTVETPGLNPYQQEVKVEWGETLDLGEVLIDPGLSIRGRVISVATAAPVEGAKVSAVQSNGGMMNGGVIFRDLVSGRLSATSDKNGTFEIFGLRPGSNYTVSASLDKFAGESVRSVPPDGEPIEIALAPGQRVTGVVLGADTGEGFAGAEVRSGGAKTVTNAAGEFVLEGVVPSSRGEMRFMFGGPRAFNNDTEKAREASVSARAPGFIEDEISVDLDRGRDGVVLTITPTIPITGVVFDPTGAPRVGALVRLIPDVPDDMGPFQFDASLIFFAVVVTNELGEFTMDRYFADENARYRVIADFPGYTRGKSEPFDLEEVAQLSPLSIGLRAAATIQGVVTGGAGPVPGAIVRLSAARDGGNPQEMMMMQLLGLPKGGEVVHADSEGRFTYEAHEPGDFDIGAEMVGYSDSASQNFAIAEGETVEIALVLDPGSILTGTVTDDLGNPIADASVRVLEESGIEEEIFEAQLLLGGALRSTRTASDGSYEIVGLAAGGYAAVAEKRGFAKGISQGIYVNGVATQHLTLLPSASLRALVTDTATGRPVSEYEVFLSLQESSVDFGNGLEPVSSPDGSFEKNDLDPGDYDLKIRAAGFGSTNIEVSLMPGVLHEERIELSRAGSIVGRVVDAVTGDPIQGAEVGIANPSSDDSDEETMRSFVRDMMLGESDRTDANGEFLLDTVPPGAALLVVNHTDYVQLRKTAPSVGSGQQAEVSLELSRGKSVSGQARTATGQIGATRFLMLTGNDDATRGVRKTTFTDEEGQFTFEGLEPGTYQIRFGFGRQGGESMAVEVSGNVEGLQVTVPDEE